jgi:hypothetical protein
MIIYSLLSIIFLWAFLGTIDGPSRIFDLHSSRLIYRMAVAVDDDHETQPPPFWIGIFPSEPRPIHGSFLLFDFKQNLRRWPNVAGDISRSPPLAI